MSAIYKTFTVESKVIDFDTGVYEVMVSTEGVDRDGDIILALGVDIDSYLKNPVVLYAHDYWDMPVAKTLAIEKQPGAGLKARFQFPEWGASEKADTVHKLWGGGFLNAASIGFIPKKWENRKDDKGEDLARGLVYHEVEMLEFSIVPVPANQAALRLAAKAMEPKSVAKRGRVLSATNEKRIREAVTSLQEVLASLGEEEPEQDSVEPPEVKTVIPYRDQGTADEGESWSAPGLSDFTDGTFADISDAEKRRIAAHYTWSANMPPENFGDLKLPHHRAAKSGVGPAVWRGVVAAMGALMGARQEVAIPDADMEGCHSHLAGHYRQFGREGDDIPELRAYSEEELLKLFPEVVDGVAESDAEPNTNDGHPTDGLTHDASDAELEAVTDSLSVLISTFREVIK